MIKYKYTTAHYYTQQSIGLSSHHHMMVVLGRADQTRRNHETVFRKQSTDRLRIMERLVECEMLVKLASTDGQFPMLTKPEDYPTLDQLAEEMNIPLVIMEEHFEILEMLRLIEYHDSDRVGITFFEDGPDPSLNAFGQINYVVREIIARMSADERHKLFVEIIFGLKVINTQQC